MDTCLFLSTASPLVEAYKQGVHSAYIDFTDVTTSGSLATRRHDLGQTNCCRRLLLLSFAVYIVQSSVKFVRIFDIFTVRRRAMASVKLPNVSYIDTLDRVSKERYLAKIDLLFGLKNVRARKPHVYASSKTTMVVL